MIKNDITAAETGLTEEEIKDQGAVFTPSELVNLMLDELDYDWENHNHQKTWLDPTMGNGQFLVQLAKRGIRVQNIYGVDIDEKNVQVTKQRLRDIYGDTKEVNAHLDNNILQKNALEYDYSFGETPDLDEAW